ncbi:MAG: oligosaccharide flippase family protein [Waltera sp.]
MADKNSSKNNFIMQAGILAAAGIISRIIGLLYRGPLQSVIGNLGLGYYQSAYNYYTIILLISSYSIPSAISKAIAQKLGEKEYRNAHRLFHGAMIYVLVVGGIASLFLFFGAGLFVSGAAVTVLRTFAPTIFVYGILGVLRGYFQAHKSMAQTSVSQILEQHRQCGSQRRCGISSDPNVYGNDGGSDGSGRAGDESNLRCCGKCTGTGGRRISGATFYGGSLCSESWNDPAQSSV